MGKDSGRGLVLHARLQPPESPRAGLLLKPLHGLGLDCRDRDKPSVFTSGDTVPEIGKKNKQEAERSAAAIEE